MDRDGELSAGRSGGAFSDGENVLNLDCGGICTTL